MAKNSITHSNFFTRPWLPHLIFWIVLISFVATNILVSSASAVDPAMSFESYKSTRIPADLRIRLSQPSLRMTQGITHYTMNGWIRRFDIVEKEWDRLRLFLVDKNNDLYLIAEQAESSSFGVITSTELDDPNTPVKVRIPINLIPPGVYFMGAELCDLNGDCYYSLEEGRHFFVTSNSMQFVKPKNLAKIQSIGTKQRALNFLKKTFFPEKQ